MNGIINLLLPLLVVTIVLYIFSRAVDRVVLRRMGRRWYLWTMWPGVVVHELSHFVACILTFTRVRRVQLYQPTADSLGFVEHDRTRNPVKKVIISLAPLFGVTATMWLIARWLFPEIHSSFESLMQSALVDFNSFQGFFSFSATYFNTYGHYLSELIKNFDASTWQTYVFIYLILSLSSHAAPSKEDLGHTYAGLFGLSILFALLYYIDQIIQVPLTWHVIQWLSAPVFIAVGVLMYGILFTVISLVILGVLSLVVRTVKRGA